MDYLETNKVIRKELQEALDRIADKLGQPVDVDLYDTIDSIEKVVTWDYD